jgi:hypothetical protein
MPTLVSASLVGLLWDGRDKTALGWRRAYTVSCISAMYALYLAHRQRAMIRLLRHDAYPGARPGS